MVNVFSDSVRKKKTNILRVNIDLFIIPDVCYNQFEVHVPLRRRNVEVHGLNYIYHLISGFVTIHLFADTL